MVPMWTSFLKLIAEFSTLAPSAPGARYKNYLQSNNSYSDVDIKVNLVKNYGVGSIGFFGTPLAGTLTK